jgi:hypothetical protein
MLCEYVCMLGCEKKWFKIVNKKAKENESHAFSNFQFSL